MSLSVLRRMKDNSSKNAKQLMLRSKNDDYGIREKIKNRNSWLLVFVVVVFTISISAIIVSKFIINDESINLDLATILSTLLAFFSIYLSATFYFKATEQSNNFYDRSYNHTKDIAESLSNMRGEFGKSLNFLEKNSDAMNQRFDSIPWKKISETEKKLEAVEKEKEDSIMKILEEAGVEKSKQAEYIQKLSEQEKHINNLNNELNILKHTNNAKDYITNYLIKYIYEIGPNKLIDAEPNFIIKMFHRFRRNLPDKLMILLADEKIIDSSGNLTKRGIEIIKSIAIEIAN
ncbi:hypothetical protein [Lederbergia citrea]|uniref:Uncharacterized protein n=1 Tax=Lederbergia citrea TaxID=2833581 RepID=A0A942UMG7_9BACI|nr:hypothetical protein [Lederbergia citrea]MBS4204027.1 hypothetical protein [Lederbergia citrea]MBS4221388.1 hypothetical protein [Lederbergia citrea]